MTIHSPLNKKDDNNVNLNPEASCDKDPNSDAMSNPTTPQDQQANTKTPTTFLTLAHELRQQILFESYENIEAETFCPGAEHSRQCPITHEAHWASEDWIEGHPDGRAVRLQSVGRWGIAALTRVAWTRTLRQVDEGIAGDAEVVGELVDQRLVRMWQRLGVKYGAFCLGLEKTA